MRLLTGLGAAAAEQGLRVDYTTTAALVIQLVDNKELSKIIGKYLRIKGPAPFWQAA